MEYKRGIVIIQRNDDHFAYNKSNSSLITIFREVFITVLLVLLSVVVFGKKNQLYQIEQITDKQVLIETRDGEQVLFTALTSDSIGVDYCTTKSMKLISANDLDLFDLYGSIYVEELDEILQITTVNQNGVVININRETMEIQVKKKDSNNLIVSYIEPSDIDLANGK